MTDKLREAALWKLLTEAREALWQPANPDLCGRIDEALAQQDAQAVPQGWVWDCCIHSKGGWKVIAHFDVPIKVGTRLNAAPTPPAQEKQS